MFQQNFQQQQQQQQQQGFFYSQSAGTIHDYSTSNVNALSNQEDVITLPRNRRDSTNYIIEKLYKETFIQRPGERNVIRTGGRKNKNEILGLTLARLIKEKHLTGNIYARDIDLSRGVQINSNTGEFILVLRMDGRIVVMSDEIEHHLGKSMRSLYTQCINIFECLDKRDGDKLKAVFNSSTKLSHQEHRLVCTFRLPKGKRPSRAREDIKTISMAGHFYTCQESCERLFIARCDALVSRTTNGSSSSQAAIMINDNSPKSMIKFLLNEDMSINMISPNMKEVLGYTRHEMVGSWLGRYLATDDLEKFEIIRRRNFDHNQAQGQTPTSICDVFDMYANNGDVRLTFLCQIRPIRERRSQTPKFAIVAQLVDPSLRNDYIKYIQSESDANTISVKAEQCHQQYRKRAKIQSWPIARHSPWASSCPTASKGPTSPIATKFRHSIDHCQRLSPRSMSTIYSGNNSLTSTPISMPHTQSFLSVQQAPSNINPTKDRQTIWMNI